MDKFNEFNEQSNERTNKLCTQYKSNSQGENVRSLLTNFRISKFSIISQLKRNVNANKSKLVT